MVRLRTTAPLTGGLPCIAQILMKAAGRRYPCTGGQLAAHRRLCHQRTQPHMHGRNRRGQCGSLHPTGHFDARHGRPHRYRAGCHGGSGQACSLECSRIISTGRNPLHGPCLAQPRPGLMRRGKHLIHPCVIHNREPGLVQSPFRQDSGRTCPHARRWDIHRIGGQ